MLPRPIRTASEEGLCDLPWVACFVWEAAGGLRPWVFVALWTWAFSGTTARFPGDSSDQVQVSEFTCSCIKMKWGVCVHQFTADVTHSGGPKKQNKTKVRFYWCCFSAVSVCVFYIKIMHFVHKIPHLNSCNFKIPCVHRVINIPTQYNFFSTTLLFYLKSGAWARPWQTSSDTMLRRMPSMPNSTV